MESNTNHDGQKLKAALDWFVQVVLLEGRIRLKTPRIRSWTLCTLVCISWHQQFFCSVWWCADPDADEEDTSHHRTSLIMFHCDSANNFLVVPGSFTISFVHPDIPGKWVGENNAQLVSWHWPVVDESIPLIVTSMIDTTILSFVIDAIACLPDPRGTIWQLRWCLEEADGYGGPYAGNVTQSLDKILLPEGYRWWLN